MAKIANLYMDNFAFFPELSPFHQLTSLHASHSSFKRLGRTDIVLGLLNLFLNSPPRGKQTEICDFGSPKGYRYKLELNLTSN